MDAPPSVLDRSVRLRELKVCRVRPKSDMDLEDLITELTSPDCAIETLDVVVTAYFYVYDGLRERFATAIGGSKSLKSVEITAPRPTLDAVKLCELLKSNEVLESFKFASPQRDHLQRLDSECWFDMLRENTKLRCLKLPSFYWEPNKLNKLLAVFSPDEASGHQDNKTLTTLEFCLVWPEQANDVANMLLTNRTIQQLSLKAIDIPADIIHVLQAFEGNNILQMLDLSRCLGVQEEQKLFDAILNCLQTNPWLHLNLEHTPLSKSGRRFSIIQQKLDQNMLFWRSWNQELVQSNGMRLFLCGSPRAGK
jgi:hypothetical protein